MVNTYPRFASTGRAWFPSITHWHYERATMCDSCEALRINGTLCHEAGCPAAWKDYDVACFECGCDFRPTERGQRVCEDCANPPIDDLDPFDQAEATA